jgi:uncharacterized protein
VRTEPDRAPRGSPGATPDRDRDAEGRPQQARPRDRTGRPLSYDATGVETIDDHRPGTPQEALALGRRLWGEQRYFEAHECLEVVWKAADEPDADLWQGVIQIAVAGVHLQRDNPAGARTLLARAERRLTGYEDGHLGIGVDAALATCRRLRADLDAGADVTADAVGGFPTSDDRTDDGR